MAGKIGLPDNWKDDIREGAGVARNGREDDLRRPPTDGGEPRRTRMMCIRCTEAMRARVVALVRGHRIKVFEFLELAVTAFEEKHGGGQPRP